MTRSMIVVWLVAACGAGGGESSTNLEGTIPCEAMPCQSQQLCRHQGQGIDAGVPPQDMCVTVSTSCAVTDCEGPDCPTCVRELCDCRTCPATVVGRMLTCLVQ